MLGHISFGVRDLTRALAFYDAVCLPLGAKRLWTFPDKAGYGPEGGEDILALFVRDGAMAPGEGFHLAFKAPDRPAVRAFHAAALGNGGSDAGQPGERPHYGPTYYAAFVIDPDGYKLEAVHQ
jgi:catechol 2,3-dioxygenase-like lactoylglutathione lyase family enzyme